jgi:uncharacterized protein (DUF924 family)
MTPPPPLIADDPHGILRFWFEEVSPKERFGGPPELDSTIRDRFLALWEEARTGALDTWQTAPRPCLALIVLLDQFPRNMFRGDPRAFATDARALAVAKVAVERGFDRKFEHPKRGVFYLPMLHSERLADQERAIACTLLGGGSAQDLLHARVHRLVIRRFGRFPYRNAALGRKSTAGEEAFLAAGGYRAALAEVSA